MSEKKGASISHRALDELIRFKTSLVTDIGQFKTDVLNAVKDIVKAVSEVQAKHNDLAAHIVAVEGMAKNTAAFAASEIGKMGGSVQRHLIDLDKSTSAIDLNVLALAEITKEVIGQLTQIDLLFTRLHSATEFVFESTGALPSEFFKKALELSGSDMQEVKTSAEKWYGDLCASAFKAVRERLDADDKARREKEAVVAQEAKEAAEKAAKDAAELNSIAEELQKINSDERSVTVTTSGGSGSAFPEGADFFGG